MGLVVRPFAGGGSPGLALHAVRAFSLPPPLSHPAQRAPDSGTRPPERGLSLCAHRPPALTCLRASLLMQWCPGDHLRHCRQRKVEESSGHHGCSCMFSVSCLVWGKVFISTSPRGMTSAPSILCTIDLPQPWLRVVRPHPSVCWACLAGSLLPRCCHL